MRRRCRKGRSEAFSSRKWSASGHGTGTSRRTSPSIQRRCRKRRSEAFSSRHMVQATKCLRGQLEWPVSPWVVPGCNFGCYPACQSTGASEQVAEALASWKLLQSMVDIDGCWELCSLRPRLDVRRCTCFNALLDCSLRLDRGRVDLVVPLKVADCET